MGGHVLFHAKVLSKVHELAFALLLQPVRDAGHGRKAGIVDRVSVATAMVVVKCKAVWEKFVRNSNG